MAWVEKELFVGAAGKGAVGRECVAWAKKELCGLGGRKGAIGLKPNINKKGGNWKLCLRNRGEAFLGCWFSIFFFLKTTKKEKTKKIVSV